jgi:serine/threonine protein kinase
MTTTPATGLSAALSGRYTLERELGGGAMSRVFLARELALGRTVVLKVLPEEMASGVSGERFAREIQLAASLSQANIVPLLAAGDAGGVPFYTMPFVAGDSLRHRMLEARGVALAALGRRDEAMEVASRLEHPTRPVRPEDGCSLAWRVCRTASRVMILAILGQRAEAAALLEDRMYRIFLNWFADWDLLGERLRGEPAFEAYVRQRG